MKGGAYVYALLTDPVCGGCAYYFYSLSISSDSIVMMHSLEKLEQKSYKESATFQSTTFRRSLQRWVWFL